MQSLPSFNRLPNPERPWFGALRLAVVACLVVSTLPALSIVAAESSGPRLAWPPPPADPRIEFTDSISRPADFGLKTSFFARIGRWLSGGDVTKASFSKPFALCVDEQDNLCLADTGQGVVWLFNRRESKFSRWEKIGNLRFAMPVGVAKAKGTIYVADTGLGCILAFDEKGKLRQQITNHLSRPAGLTIYKDRLFVADSQRHCVVRFDLRGRYQSEFGSRGSGPDQFNFPTHIAVDAAGRLYVTDSLNARVISFDQEGKPLKQVGSLGNGPGQFSRPKGLALDTQGDLCVLDAVFDTLQVFQPSGNLLVELGSTGAKPGQFWLPSGIAISSRNEVFIADTYNRRIQIFKILPPR